MEIIEKILAANKIEDLLSINNFKDEFKTIIKQIHPDVCNDPSAKQATAKITEMKDHFENGKEYKDESGPFRTNGYFLKYPKTILAEASYHNYKKLKSFKDPSSLNFHRYLPKEMTMESDQLTITFENRAIPLSKLTLPQEHVNWVLNRLLEFSAWLAQNNIVHCGFTPESVFVVPESHGIQIASFYHLSKANERIGTIPAQYAHWFPSYIFNTKIAETSIDLETAQKLAIYLLGDTSGSGTKLRKTHNAEYVNFLLSHHEDAYEALMKYKELLSRNFKKQFHTLTI